MLPETLTLDPVIQAHTWPGIPSITRVDTPEGGTPAPPASALALAEIRFSPSPKATDAQETTYNSTTHNTRIAITSAANWQITIPPQILPFQPGRWDWLISTTSAAGTRQPLLKGTLTIRPQP
jgi:hypothetical protein